MNSNSRPYLNSTINKLEALFAENQADEQITSAILAELTHRQTKRAKKLRERVEQVVSAVGKTEPPSNIVSFPQKLPEPRQAAPRQLAFPAELPPSLGLAKLKAKPLPAGEDQPLSILAAWTAFETLDPVTYKRPVDLVMGRRNMVIDVERDGGLPWETGNTRSIPHNQLFFLVPLGAVLMKPSTTALVDAFGTDEEHNARDNEKSVMAAVLVDKAGVPLKEKSVWISSFGWALPHALKKDLATLGEWDGVESALVGALEKIVGVDKEDDEGQPIVLDATVIDVAHRWLVRELGLDPEMVEAPSHALKHFHHFKSKTPPEIPFFNSFFLNDLKKVSDSVRSRQTPTALKRYLGIDKPGEVYDLFENRPALEEAIAPAAMPLNRWPADGGHPLVLLQQAAVNIARSELAGKEAIVAVNGPPGTGKTTLLRDVVAATVLDRALAMSRFDDPNDAFQHSKQRMKAGPAFFQIYQLDPSLRGHELLVASSNNKAVENVSQELPKTGAVGRGLDDLNYFKTLSDQLQKGPTKPEEEGDFTEQEDSGDEETWGLIAAVLGNKKKRGEFVQTFWWDKEAAFRLYLKAAKGDVVDEEVRNDAGEFVERRKPDIVENENPPTPEKAKAAWLKARGRLLSLKAAVEKDLADLETARKACSQGHVLADKVQRQERDLTKLVSSREESRASEQSIDENLRRISNTRENLIAALQHHKETRPGALSRLMRRESASNWSAESADLRARESEARKSEKALAASLKVIEIQNRKASAELAKAEQALTATRAEMAKQQTALHYWKSCLGERMIDEGFFSREHEEKNLTPPWLPKELHKKREDLFIAAMDVHRAFVTAAAQKVLHNLSALMPMIQGGYETKPERIALQGDLWSTLFCVVPVVSTTFASVDRMFGQLGEGTIGWLIVDEAGQANPQNAVGALLRSKRAIVVGDPLQVPPVVTLPERLVQEICRHFDITAKKWAAPEASVQTLSDRASSYQASFQGDQGPRPVGIPLLVHRRCQEPMFSISNRIAYDGQMVHAVADAPSKIGEILGPSRWFNVEGEASSKWCPAEGEAALRLLAKLGEEGLKNPDIFLITPFRDVKYGMSKRLEGEKGLFDAFGIPNIKKWIDARVGTIHTFQGREADSAILVLGAPAQGGARAWASETPNILNVAVSRAKKRLYVVGSHKAWAGVGHAREMSEALPVLNWPASSST